MGAALHHPAQFAGRSEKRGAERFPARMSVQVQGTNVAGITRDQSASGLSFTAEHAYPVGTHLDFTLSDEQGQLVLCDGVVMHCEPAGSLSNIGVRLLATMQVE